MVDSSDRYYLSQTEEFIGRVKVLLTGYALDVLTADTSGNALSSGPSMSRHLSLEILTHIEDYGKRAPMQIAALLPNESVHIDASDEVINEAIDVLFQLMTGEEL